MPTPSRSLVTRPAARLAAVLLVAALVAGCGLLGSGSIPVVGDGPLVTYVATGGECPAGECGFKAVIYRDGAVDRSDGMAQTVDPMSLARLVDQVGRADWAAILGRPFEGECPRNVDGQEEIYTFHVAAEPIVVASCTVLVDHRAEPFQSVQGILFGVGG